MESYEEFCNRSLEWLQTEGKMQVCSKSSGQQGALSIIRFHGRAVLAPLLSADQRSEMAQYRQSAAQLQADRQSLRKSILLARVQDIIENVQVRKGTGESEDSAPLRPEPLNEFALLPSTSSPPWSARDGGATGARNGDLPVERESLALPNAMGEGCVEREEEEDDDEEKEEWGKGDEEEDGGHSLSLETLLKKSRVYLERGRGQRGSWGSGGSTPVQADSLSDKENESSGHSPPSCPRPLGLDPDDSPAPRSLTGSYTWMPGPEPSLSPRLHRHRPRPVSGGNILISRPVSAVELSPGKAQGDGAMPAGSGATAGGKCSPDRPSPADSPPPSAVRLLHSSLSGAGILCDLAVPVSTSAPSPARHDGTAPGFHRCSYTLDSPTHPVWSGPPLDQIQERAPRLLGGPEPQPAPRKAPTTINKSYDVESPSPALQRPHVTLDHAPSLAELQMELEGSYEGRVMLKPLVTPMKEQHSTTGEVQRRVTALEEARRQMEEQHAQQLSLLIAEQEREQQHLRQEMEEKEWMLRDQGGDQALGDSRMSTPRCLGHRIGFPSLLSPETPSPAVQSPICRWGPSRGASKARSRLSQLLTPERQQVLCRLSAVARGFLTRRLLNTEKLKLLRQTILDTREFIQSFQTDALLKRGPLSVQDMSLKERLKAQLRAALYEVHDVFFVLPLEERLELLQQDRQLHAERKLRKMEKARSPKGRGVLSVATQRSLDRRKQRVSNTPGQGRKPQQKPQSPPINRVLQPNQGLNAALPGQTEKHGSLNRKSPEERVMRSYVLKKPNSLR